jgi:opacity protein-like surface antigen
MRNTYWTLAMLVCVVVAVSAKGAELPTLLGGHQDSGWFTGVEGGYVLHTLKVETTSVDGLSSEERTDRAKGGSVSLVGGYRIPISSWFSTSLRLHGGLSGAEGEIKTAEPATRTYAIPFNYGAALVPEIHPGRFQKIASLFAVLEAGQGYAEASKSSPGSATYDTGEWLTSYSVGVGSRLALANRIELSLIYKYTAYDDFAADTVPTDESPSQTITGSFSTISYLVGLAYRF